MGHDDELKNLGKDEKTAAEAARDAYRKRAAQHSAPPTAAEETADKAAEAYEKRAAKHSVPGREKKAKPATTGDIAEHTVVSGDNLSHIARRYYGSADNWKAIYAANKETIGDNPNAIRVGQVLRIPRLDE